MIEIKKHPKLVNLIDYASFCAGYLMGLGHNEQGKRLKEVIEEFNNKELKKDT